VVAEADPQRRNLVLSHRAVLEREKEAAREKLLAELEVGQVREGIVSNVRDFGAFVDLGGVDGLVHVSQLSWDRVGHPSEVLEVGQQVQVKIDKLDKDSGKISLSYRELLESPWTDVETKFSTGSIVSGTVSKIMDFGAFVRLAAGVEGLIHVSELAHQHVARVAQIVSEGQEVQVKVLSVDAENQRISLSLKAVQAPPSADTSVDQTESEEDASETRPARRSGPQKPLKGGFDRRTGGEDLGLKW
jgi:small subunit ribosomal protein S1